MVAKQGVLMLTVSTDIERRAELAEVSAAASVDASLPPGSYLSYSSRLKSNVSLYLGQGATIVAAGASPAGTSGGYDPPEPNQWDTYQDFGHSHWHNSLIWGEEIFNVSILGPGRIW